MIGCSYIRYFAKWQDIFPSAIDLEGNKIKLPPLRMVIHEELLIEE
jgi:hypothetical protein